VVTREAPSTKAPTGGGGSGGGSTEGDTGGSWRYDREVSWYGPGFYGNRTACGQTYTKSIMGVAHRSLPCGTKVSFKYGSRVITVPVIDRGPYVAGRNWDLSAAACRALSHCFTGPIYWRFP
jgi:rare lipoprotein A (peptidoglycan hydrolase)